jgi:hypothetical protein
MLAIIINRAKEKDQVSGLIPNLVDGGVYIYNMLMTQNFIRSGFRKSSKHEANTLHI